MRPIFRRNLLQAFLCGVGLSVRPRRAAGQSRRFVTRRIDEMTSREVELYLNEGGDLVFVPFGPVSGHGAYTPLGMHAHWANALSVLLAEKANGLVFPATFACFAGATRTFRGTVSFPVEEQVSVLKRIARTLHAAGFRRTVLVAGTNPEDTGGGIAARSLFDETEAPYLFLQGSRLLDTPEARAIYKDYPGVFGEALVEMASLRILGRERPIPLPELARQARDEGGDQPAELTDDTKIMRKFGIVGWRYFEEKQHGYHGTAGLTFRGKPDIDMAVEVLDKCADLALPALKSFSHYGEFLEKHPPHYVNTTDRPDGK